MAIPAPSWMGKAQDIQTDVPERGWERVKYELRTNPLQFTPLAWREAAVPLARGLGTSLGQRQAGEDVGYAMRGALNVTPFGGLKTSRVTGIPKTYEPTTPRQQAIQDISQGLYGSALMAPVLGGGNVAAGLGKVAAAAPRVAGTGAIIGSAVQGASNVLQGRGLGEGIPQAAGRGAQFALKTMPTMLGTQAAVSAIASKVPALNQLTEQGIRQYAPQTYQTVGQYLRSVGDVGIRRLIRATLLETPMEALTYGITNQGEQERLLDSIKREAFENFIYNVGFAGVNTTADAITPILRDAVQNAIKSYASMSPQQRQAGMFVPGADVTGTGVGSKPVTGEPGTVEISDATSKLGMSLSKMKGAYKMGARQKLADVLQHKDLYKIYPELADTKVNFKANPNEMAVKDAIGTYDPETGEITVLLKDPGLAAPGTDVRKTLLHEIQHAVQKMTGIAPAIPAAKGVGWTAYAGQPKELQAKATELRTDLPLEQRGGDAYAPARRYVGMEANIPRPPTPNDVEIARALDMNQGNYQEAMRSLGIEGVRTPAEFDAWRRSYLPEGMTPEARDARAYELMQEQAKATAEQSRAATAARQAPAPTYSPGAAEVDVGDGKIQVKKAGQVVDTIIMPRKTEIGRGRVEKLQNWADYYNALAEIKPYYDSQGNLRAAAADASRFGNISKQQIPAGLTSDARAKRILESGVSVDDLRRVADTLARGAGGDLRVKMPQANIPKKQFGNYMGTPEQAEQANYLAGEMGMWADRLEEYEAAGDTTSADFKRIQKAAFDSADRYMKFMNSIRPDVQGNVPKPTDTRQWQATDLRPKQDTTSLAEQQAKQWASDAEAAVYDRLGRGRYGGEEISPYKANIPKPNLDQQQKVALDLINSPNGQDQIEGQKILNGVRALRSAGVTTPVDAGDEMAVARAMGEAAQQSGQPRTPWQTGTRELIRGKKPGEASEIFREWLSGWDDANLQRIRGTQANVPRPVKQPLQLTDQIIAYENGELTEPEMIELFQNLIDNGMVWQLQGHYGRTAQDLLDAGLIQPLKSRGIPTNVKKKTS